MYNTKRKKAKARAEKARAAKADKLLKLFFKGKLKTQKVVARDKYGNPLEDHELPVYSEVLVEFHTKPAEAASLPMHIMRPRVGVERPIFPTKWEVGFLTLEAFVKRLGFKYNMQVSRVPFHPTYLVLGPVPDSWNTLWHGTVPYCLDNILKIGLEPKTCLRRCDDRADMGEGSLTSAYFQTASQWSQYTDVGFLKKKPTRFDAIGYFSNAMLCFNLDVQQIDATAWHTERIRPYCVSFEYRTEAELAQANRRIFSHVGTFV